MQITSKIRIGTRASKLALAQVEEVKNLLASHIPLSQIETVPIATSGDKIQDRNLAEIGGKGLFVKELEEALLQDKIDIAIHSAKDVPPILHSETILAAFTVRADPRDCLISKKYSSLASLPQGAVVGTSSARRKAILLHLRPDLQIVNFRGNVDTRLAKVEKENVDASILAVCGLTRLHHQNHVKEIFDKDVFLPAGGQGSLAIQIRKSDTKNFELLAKINHEETQICVETERAFLQELGASCTTPVAVHAWLEHDSLELQTMVFDNDGSEYFGTSLAGKLDLEEGINLGISAARKTKNEADSLLKKIIVS